VEAISQDGDKCKVDPAVCVDCGACEGACPTGAIKAE
jgi:NAD-dependent dihydropyrimidine dehydrogenase PreA subunit